MPGRSFAAMLEEALAREACEAPAASAWAWRATPPLGSAFLFSRPLIVATPRWPADASSAAPRPAHRLTDVQRHAYERLLRLGAELPPGFTGDELRREYRRLARRYHPDACPTGSPLERAQLARAFCEAAEDYRCLRVVVEPVH